MSEPHATLVLDEASRKELQQRLARSFEFLQAFTEPPETPCLIAMQDGEASQRIDCPPGRTTLGRSPEADLVFDDAKLSRIHTVFVRISDDVFLIDQNSRNGTWVNGESVTEKALVSGDHIVLGLTRFLFV